MKKHLLKLFHFFLKPLFYALNRYNQENLKLLQAQTQIAQQNLVTNYQTALYLDTIEIAHDRFQTVF